MRLVNVISPDMFPLVGVYGNEAPTFSQKLGDRSASLFMNILQKDSSQVLKKDLSGLQKRQRSSRRFTSQRSRGKIYNYIFSKVNAVRKKGEGFGVRKKKTV